MSFQEVEIDQESLKQLIDLNWLKMKTITLIEEEDAVAKGESNTSVMRRLTITGNDLEGKTVHKKIVMKKDKTTQGNELNLFSSEIQVYKEVLPAFEEVMKSRDKNSSPDLLWAVCCGVRNYDIILLEDLVAAGFTMRNRRVPLTAEVATFSAEQIGRFHGLSCVAIKRKLFDPKILGPNKFASNMPILNSLFTSGLQTLADSIENEAQWKPILPKLRLIAKDVGNILVKLAEDVKDVYPVINHGDCWTNNMLFKYENNSDTPISVKFVDFQATHYSCFAWDLTYLMHTSMSAKTRQHCYKKMIERYRRSLIETLDMFQEDSSQVPDINSMLQIMDRLALFGLVVAISFFSVTISIIESPWDLEKAYSGESATSHAPQLFENEIFKESFKIDVERFKTLGLL